MSSEDLGAPGGDNTEAQDEDKAEDVGEEEVPVSTTAHHDPLYKDFESMRATNSAESLDEELRDKWGNPMEFIMTCLSTAVGLGNVWRFPFTAYDNGGGAFLIPFLIILVLLGTPLYFLEMTLGQFSTRGPIGIWEMAPICRGVGWAFMLIAVFTVFYYVSILATCFVYLIYGFSSVLPWKNCYWDDNLKKSDYYATENRKIFESLKCNNNMPNASGLGDATWDKYSNGSAEPIGNAELFFQYAVAKRSDNFDHGIGAPDWKMSLALYFAWLLVFLNTMLGTKLSGKCAYFTALFPYFVLFVLFFKAITLDGSGAGISHFFSPDWAKIGSPEVWFRAVGQCFFSLGVGFGVIPIYGSYNPFRRRVYKDILFICIMDTLTSILAGATVFAIVGVLAKRKGVAIGDVTQGGNGLAFVAYPEIVVQFEKDGAGAAPTFSAFFFLMLITLGIGSGSSYITGLSGTVYDRVPYISNRKWLRTVFVGLMCFLFATFGLVFATPGGNYILDLFDTFSSGFVVYAIVIFQFIGIAYIYGAKNFVRDLQFMFSHTTKYRCLYKSFEIWAYVIPIILSLILIYVLATVEPLKTQDNKNFPLSLQIMGWGLFGLIVLTVPIFAMVIYFTRKSSSRYRKLLACVKPTKRWGPKILHEKAEWIQWKRGYDGHTKLWKLTFGKWCGDGMKPSEPGQPPEPAGAFSDEDVMNIESIEGIEGKPEELADQPNP